MEEFKKKTVNDMILWLKNETYSERICAIFEGMGISGVKLGIEMTNSRIADLLILLSLLLIMLCF